MSCNISIPMEEIIEAVREELAKEFISIEDGVGNNTTLNSPNIKGDVTFDSAARDALCSALAECVDEKLKALEDKLDGKIEDTEAALSQAIADAKEDLEADIDLLRKRFEDSQTQQDEAFNAKIAAQKELFEQAIAAGDAALGTRIDGLDTKVDHQREDLEKAIEAGDDALGARIDGLDGKVDHQREDLEKAIAAGDAALETRIDGLDGKVDHQREDLENAIAAGDDALGARIDGLDGKVDQQREGLENAIAAGDAALDTRIDNLDGKVDNQREDLEDDIDLLRTSLEDLRRETKIKSIERTDDTVTVELMDGTKFSFSVADDECNDCGRAVDFDISEDGNSLDITLADGTKLDLTHKELTDWLASKDSALATDQELQDVYDALDADKVSKDELCELAVPCIQDLLDNLPPEKFISEHTVDGNKLISTYNTGDTIEVELPIPESSGLDCEAISELDEKGWEDGTTLLAQSGDGECYRLGNIASLFHDVGIGIGYASSRQETDKDVEITYTITNTGNNKVDAVDLAIVIPTDTTDHTFKIKSVTPNGVDSHEKIDDLNYKIKGMASGATFKVVATVKSSKSGTYQTSAQATTASPFEQNVENNIATAIINFYDPKSNYVPTTDCPLIIATDVATGTELNTFGLGTKDNGDVLGRANVFLTDESLAGKKVKLKGASTVISNCTVWSDSDVLSKNEPKPTTLDDSYNIAVGESNNFSSLNRYSALYSAKSGRVMSDYVYMLKAPKSKTLSSPEGDGLVTFNQSTEIATFADNPNIRAAVIYMRPDGEDCRWQAIYVISTNTLPVDPSCRNITKVSGSATHKWVYSTEEDNVTAEYLDILPTVKYVGGTDPKDWIVARNDGIKSILGKRQAVISHNAGTASEFKLVDTCGDAKNYMSSGAVTTSWDEDTNTLTINITASAKATDSQTWEFLKIDIT